MDTALGSWPMEVLTLSTSQSNMREYKVFAKESLLSVAAFASMGLTMGPAPIKRDSASLCSFGSGIYHPMRCHIVHRKHGQHDAAGMHLDR